MVEVISGTPTDVDAAEVAEALGKALRDRRKKMGLTLTKLAELCGLSQPFLSQLENGKAMPSLMALHKVAQALETTAHDLLETRQEMEISLVRAGDDKSYELLEGATVRFLVRGVSHFMEPNEVTAEPGFRTSRTAHGGEEMVYVLEGRLRVILEDTGSEDLEPGDAYTFPATKRHSLQTLGTDTCRFLIISSPPGF